MSANKGAIVIVVNVITENLFYIYLYPATYQTLFDISIFKFTKLNNYPLQLIINLILSGYFLDWPIMQLQ